MFDKFSWGMNAAKVLMSWDTVTLTPLAGSSETSSVVRATRTSSGESAVLKKYGPDEFVRALFAAGCASPPFAQALTFSNELRVIAFEDYGDQTLSSFLTSADERERYKIASAYVDLVAKAHRELLHFGIPPSRPGTSSVDEILGIPRATIGAASVTSLTQKLDNLLELTKRQQAPAKVRKHSLASDSKVIAWAQALWNVSGQWILGDTNPYNILLRDGLNDLVMVDIQPILGIPAIDFMPLGGTPFRLDTVTLAKEFTNQLKVSPQDFQLLNGWFSVTSLYDTAIGLQLGELYPKVGDAMN